MADGNDDDLEGYKAAIAEQLAKLGDELLRMRLAVDDGDEEAVILAIEPVFVAFGSLRAMLVDESNGNDSE